MSPRKPLPLLLLAVLVCSCGDTRSRTGEKVLYYYLRGEVNTLDPARGSLEHEKSVQSQMYEPLYEYHYLIRPYKLQPLLASEMPHISGDRLTYTIPIKHGVRYHDDPCFPDGKGREVVAPDFVYAWKRLGNSTLSDGYWIFAPVAGFNEWRDAAEASGQWDYTQPVEGFQALDPYTIQIRLKQPYPQLLYILAMVYTPPLPKECVDTYGEEFGNHAIGTGPFRLEKWVRGSRAVLVRNPTFRDEYYPTEGSEEDRKLGLLDDAGKKLPFLDRIIFKEMVEATPRWLSFISGELDTIKVDKDNHELYFDTSDLSNPDQPVRPEWYKKGFRGWHLPLLDLTYEAFNMEDPVVGGAKGKPIRQAICLVRNFEKRNAIHYVGTALMAVGPIPPGLQGYEPLLPNPYRSAKGDLEGAKKILRDAGIDPSTVPELVYDTYTSSDSRQLSENFLGHIRDLGFKVRLQISTWPEFDAKKKKKEAQMWGLAWGADYPDAENFLQLYYCPNKAPGSNESNYCNPEYDKLYEQALTMEDTPARTELYRAMARIVIEDCPICPDMHRTRHYAYHKRLKNFRPDETKENYMKYWRIDMSEDASPAEAGETEGR
jgi:peptide/nickel transport system substrate-binding protein